MERIFSLYHDEDGDILRIEELRLTKKALEISQRYGIEGWPGIFYLTSVRFISADKTALYKLARELKNEWVAEAEERLNQLESLEIEDRTVET